MKKFKKTLVYEFEGSTALKDIATEFSDEVIHKTAPDDYKDLLKPEDFVNVECFLTDVFDNFKNDLFDLDSLKYVGANFSDLAMFDVDFLQSKGVEVKNIKGQATEPVVQFMLSVLLNVSRKTTESLKFAKDGGHGFSDFKGTELGSHTVGVYGLGSIGKRFAEIMQYFGSEIKHTSQTEKDGFTKVSLDQLANNSDVLVVTVPLTEKIKASITTDVLAKLNKNAVILCPTRLDVINVPDLISYLKDNQKSTFWMDGNHGDAWNEYHEELLKLDNFLVTPGNGFFTEENRPRALELTKNNLINYLNG